MAPDGREINANRSKPGASAPSETVQHTFPPLRAGEGQGGVMRAQLASGYAGLDLRRD